MHFKKTYVFCTVFCYFLSFASSFAVSLDDAIDIAKSNNRNIRLEELKFEVTKTSKTQAIAEFLPNVSANTTYGQRNSHYQGQTYDRSTKQRTEEIKIEQPIFDGLHSVSKYREANYKIQSGQSKTSDKVQEISFIASQVYCNLYRYQELIKIREENKTLGKKFLDLVNRRKDVRIIDKSDLIKLSYEASQTEEKYFDALSKLNKAKFDYQNVVGHLHENLTTPKIQEEEFNKDMIVEMVISGNHSIRSQHYSYLASKSAYNAEKSAFLPKVSITASNSKQENVVYLNNQDLNSRSVFLNVTIPIFQKGVEYANLSKAQYERDAAMEEYHITKENITKEINQALEEHRFFSDINKTNKKLYEMAQNRVEIFDRRIELKAEDPLEEIRAKIEANERKMNYIESQMDLVIIQQKIKYFLGEI